MKKSILLLAILTFSIHTKAQKVNWLTLEKALEMQKENPKKIIMDVYTNWCGPCKMLDKNTFQNKDVATFINENYYAVKFNGEGNETLNYKGKSYNNPNYDASKANSRNSSHGFARFMGINAYPTIVFMNEKGDLVMPLRGYFGPNQLEMYLKLFKGEAYKNITTKEKFEAYSNAFKPEFKVPAN
ncbi:thioredoxin fold domain-containing protein [uncultured Polaribacter sp.]|uniref:thioredoxin family protein n=1 Tax=uncultured Polaribacter sp. TaxID=174711 RepID=UPI002602280C|nr:thioredoxin fold domain-containing protein [uncultured Polaribacter sp.]